LGGVGTNGRLFHAAPDGDQFYVGGSVMRAFPFRIKAASCGIVGNIVIEANDEHEGQNKLMRRYPGCTILDCGVR
jgi:hypothetical protein